MGCHYSLCAVWFGYVALPDGWHFITLLTSVVPQTTPKLIKKARASLDVSYSYLGGAAFGRDKKGRVTKDDSSTSADMQAAGHMGDGGDYSAYVCYEFGIQ